MIHQQTQRQHDIKKIECDLTQKISQHLKNHSDTENRNEVLSKLLFQSLIGNKYPQLCEKQEDQLNSCFSNSLDFSQTQIN